MRLGARPGPAARRPSEALALCNGFPRHLAALAAQLLLLLPRWPARDQTTLRGLCHSVAVASPVAMVLACLDLVPRSFPTDAEDHGARCVRDRGRRASGARAGARAARERRLSGTDVGARGIFEQRAGGRITKAQRQKAEMLCTILVRVAREHANSHDPEHDTIAEQKSVLPQRAAGVAKRVQQNNSPPDGPSRS